MKPLALLFIASAVVFGAQQPASAPSWLDAPLMPWNADGPPPLAPAARDSGPALAARCHFAQGPATPATRIVAASGWMPYLHFDREIVRGDVEIIGGLSAATEGCEPAGFNVFVVVNGHFAGTLSPVPMVARRDGAIGAVRIVSPESITAEFARYKPGDSDCCPSSHIRVTFRIDRSGRLPVVVPVEARQVRG